MEPVRGFTLHEALAVSPAKIQTIMIWKPKHTKKNPVGLQIRRNWVGNEVFYLNVEENYVEKESRHFYRLYAIVKDLRDTAILY